MSIYRGAGGSGDAVNDSSSEALITLQARDAALAAQAAAEAAQTAAELAETNAETAETNAETAETNAETAETNAETAATNAASSASAASTSASNASTSASAASTSASNASSSASSASTSATNAANSASTATTQATNASNSASAASTSASNAATSESNAATSATNAAASYDSFDDRYLGAKSSAPTLDNDGNALLTGALYFNTTTNEMKVWSGSAWLNAYASLSGALLATNNLSDLNNTTTARTNLGVAIGTDVQGYDAQLADIAGLTPSDNNFIVGNGTNFVTESGSTARTSLGLGSIATQDANNVAVTGGSINGTAIGGTTAAAGKFTTLEATGVSTFAAGTVSAPAITTTGDTNTGIFFPAADTIAFTEGGVESMRIDSAGLVGIGCTPVSNLQVNSSSDTGVAMSNSSSVTSGNRGTISMFNSGNSTCGYIRFGAVTDNVGTDIQFANRPAGGSLTERMRIDSSGQVGVGVTPSAWGASWKSLSVNTVGALAATTGVTRLFHNAFNNDSANVYRTTAAASMYSQDAGTHQWFYAASGTAGNAITFTQAMTLDASGNVQIGTTTGSDKLTVSGAIAARRNAGGYVLKFLNSSSGDDLSGFIYDNNQDNIEITAYDSSYALTFKTNNTERMRIAAAGNVGIGDGTITPASQLHVYKSLATAEISLQSAGASGKRYIFQSNTDGSLGFYDNNAASERMRIDSSGNVGIGTTSPLGKLEVRGNGNTAIYLHTGNNAGDNSLLYFGDTGSATVGLLAYDHGTNAMTFHTNSAERMRITSAGLLQFDSGYGSVATAYGCRAWVNWNGTGTVAIRASGNVSSITDNGTGDYTINYTNSIVDANYSLVGFTRSDNDVNPAANISMGSSYSPATGSARVMTGVSNSKIDFAVICVAIFR